MIVCSREVAGIRGDFRNLEGEHQQFRDAMSREMVGGPLTGKGYVPVRR